METFCNTHSRGGFDRPAVINCDEYEVLLEVFRTFLTFSFGLVEFQPPLPWYFAALGSIICIIQGNQ